MYVPEQFDTVIAILKGNKEPPGGWSSLIGIVTAIVGNVLISFALNTQRYAHLRLQKEADEREERRSGAATPTQRPFDARRHDVGKAGHDGAEDEYEEDNDYDAEETDALLPMARKDDESVSSSQSDSDNDSKQTNYLKSPYWWIGIALMVIGEAGNFLAYGFAPASIVSPLGVVALISNCIIAPIMLREKFRKRDVLGVVISVAGAVTVVLSAQVNNPKLGPDQIWRMVKRWEFLTYLGITVALAIVLMLLSNRYGRRTILIDLGLVGLFGGYTALSTKGVSSLLSSRLWRVFAFPIFYLLVAILVGTAVMQIKYVNRALQRFDSTQVIPVQFVIFTISVIVGSAVLYRDFESTTVEKAIQFVGGCALTFLGVWLITSGRRYNRDQNDQDDDEEQGITLQDEEPSEAGLTTRGSPPHTPKRGPLSKSAIDSPASFATAPSNLATPRTPHLNSTKSSSAVPSRRLQPGASSSSSSVPPPRDVSLRQTPGHSPRHRPKTPHTSSDPRLPLSTYATPSGGPSGHLLAPDASANAESAARTLWPRHSISSLVNPKALTSPLSSGLSVVVADSLRRTESTRSNRARRASGTRPRKGSSGAGRALNLATQDATGTHPDQALPSSNSSVVESSNPSSRRTSTADADLQSKSKVSEQ